LVKVIPSDAEWTLGYNKDCIGRIGRRNCYLLFNTSSKITFPTEKSLKSTNTTESIMPKAIKYQKDWKPFKLADGTMRMLPDWADKPLGFAVNPDAVLAEVLTANRRKTGAKSSRPDAETAVNLLNRCNQRLATIRFRNVHNPKKLMFCFCFAGK